MGTASLSTGPDNWPRNRRTALSLLGALVFVWLLGTSSIVRTNVIAGSKVPKPVILTEPPIPAIPMAMGTPAPGTPEATTPGPQAPGVANVAVLLETDPRRVPSLVPVMLHFANFLGPNWPVVLMTAEENWELPPSRLFRTMVELGRIRIMFLPRGTTFPDHHSVSLFMTQPWLWEQFEHAHRLLMFQTDSILCTNSDLTVDDFLQWDLIGAPIGMQYGHGYNGGLSLRNPKVMLEVTRRWGAEFLKGAEDDQTDIPNEIRFEDQWFYGKLREMKAALPPVEVAQTFAVESIDYERPMGYHQPQRWQAHNLEKISQWCPEMWMLGDRRF